MTCFSELWIRPHDDVVNNPYDEESFYRPLEDNASL